MHSQVALSMAPSPLGVPGRTTGTLASTSRRQSRLQRRRFRTR